MPHPHLILTGVLFYSFFLFVLFFTMFVGFVLFAFFPSCDFPVGTLLSLSFLVCAFVSLVLNWWISSLVSFTRCITHLVFSFFGLLLFSL